MAFIGNTNTTQAFTPAVDYFSGNGSTTAFTLSRPVASVAQVEAVIDNVVQNPSSAYTVSSNTITFTSAPLAGTNNIYVRYTSPITQVIAPGQGTVNTTALGNITNIASGNSSLTLQTGSSNTTAVTIDTSQNVGVGTSSPTGKLDVSSSSAGVTAGDLVVDTANKTVYVGRQSSTGGDNSYLVVRGRVNGSGTNQAIAITGDTTAYGTGLFRPNNDMLGFSTLATERMRIDSSGNVGIGTSSPNTKLQASAGSNGSGVVNTLRLQNVGTSAGDGAKILFTAGTSTEGAGIASTGVALDSADLRFYAGGNTERMRIDSSGNLLMSTARSSARGLVDIPTVGGSSSVCLGISRGGDAGTMVNFYSTNSSTTVIGSIGNSGNTNTTYNTSSDYRLKDEVTPMSGALNKVSALRPVTWKWKSTGADGQGFVAHELAEVVPDCVTGEKDAVDADGNPVYQGVDTSYLVATLTKAIQELKAINDQQAETINALTARIEALEGR